LLLLLLLLIMLLLPLLLLLPPLHLCRLLSLEPRLQRLRLRILLELEC